MSDDRLFVSNNPIGRKWYYLNILILLFLGIITSVVFTVFIIPYINSDFYKMTARVIMYFLHIVYIMTLFSLVDRRLYDILGTRDNKIYKSVSSFIWVGVILQLLLMYCLWKQPVLPVSNGVIFGLALIFDLIFFFIVIITGFFEGKISNQAYEHCRKKSKYKY